MSVATQLAEPFEITQPTGFGRPAEFAAADPSPSCALATPTHAPGDPDRPVRSGRPVQPDARGSRRRDHLALVGARRSVPALAPAAAPSAPSRRSLSAVVVAPVSVLRVPAGGTAVSPVRLTRRGIVALAATVLALCGALWWIAAASAAAPAPASAPSPATVTVAPGDTLWDIAARVAPQRDPRAEVAQLERRNHLRAAQIVPGQILHVR